MRSSPRAAPFRAASFPGMALALGREVYRREFTAGLIFLRHRPQWRTAMMGKAAGLPPSKRSTKSGAIHGDLSPPEKSRLWPGRDQGSSPPPMKTHCARCGSPIGPIRQRRSSRKKSSSSPSAASAIRSDCANAPSKICRSSPGIAAFFAMHKKSDSLWNLAFELTFSLRRAFMRRADGEWSLC